MFNRKNCGAWAGIVVLLAGISHSSAQVPYIPDSAVNLGKVRQGEIVEHRFLIRNPGAAPARLRIADLSHPGMKVRMPQELLPGATGWITVTWDTHPVQGEMAAQVLLLLSDSESAVLSLSAHVIPPIEILPYPAVFISAFRDETVTRTLQIVNNDAVPLNILGVSGESKAAAQSFSTTVSTVEAGRRYQVSVDVKPTMPTGKSQHELRVFTDHPRFPIVRIPVNLFVKDDVYANPESVDFGQITGRTRAQESFLIQARSGAMKILGAATDLSFLKITETHPGAAASTHQFDVEIEGNPAQGRFTGNIYISTDDPSFPKVRVEVSGEVLGQ
jgi:hypothetical protein